MYVCIYICLYVCMCVCVSVSMCMCVCMHTCISLQAVARDLADNYKHTHTHTHTHNLADKAVEGPDGGKQRDMSPQIRKRTAQVRNYRKVCGCVEGLEEDPLQRDAYVHV